MGEGASRGDYAAHNREPFAPSGWVTTQQAAKALGISPRTVRWHIEQGNLEAKAEGEGVRRTWFVSIDGLQAFRDARQDAGELPVDYRASLGDADSVAAAPGSAIRELADRLVEEAARASEFRVRLELTEQAASTVREELAEERRRREEAERTVAELRRELEAVREPRESPTEAAGGADREEARPAGGEAQEGTQTRPWWRRMFSS